MNFDMIWQNMRYIMLTLSTVAATTGWLSAEHASQLGQVASDTATWAQIGGSVFLVGTWAWGIIVKWRTKAVPEVVAGSPLVPTVSGATGKIEEPEKFVKVPEVPQHAYGLMASAPGRSYAGIELPYTLSSFKLRMGYSYITPYWNRIPARTSNKIAAAIKGGTSVVLTKEDFDGIPDDLWVKLRPYL